MSIERRRESSRARRGMASADEQLRGMLSEAERPAAMRSADVLPGAEESTMATGREGPGVRSVRVETAESRGRSSTTAATGNAHPQSQPVSFGPAAASSEPSSATGPREGERGPSGSGEPTTAGGEKESAVSRRNVGDAVGSLEIVSRPPGLAPISEERVGGGFTATS